MAKKPAEAAPETEETEAEEALVASELDERTHAEMLMFYHEAVKSSRFGKVQQWRSMAIGVFSIFATLSTIDMKQMGVGLATAILLDATLIRAVVLPALMTTLGKANWWTPRWLQRREETAPQAAKVLEPVG